MARAPAGPTSRLRAARPGEAAAPSCARRAASATAPAALTGDGPEATTDNGPDGLGPGAGRSVPAGQPAPLPLLREVSFRTRISVLVGVAVGVAVAMAALVSYVAVSRQLEQQANSNLQSAVDLVPSPGPLRGPRA